MAAADRYFGNSPIEITKPDGRKLWRIKTTLPGTSPAHTCGTDDLEIDQAEYNAEFRGDGCGDPPKPRYRFERKTAEGDVPSNVAEELEEAADQLQEAAEQLQGGAGKLDKAADKLPKDGHH